MSCFKNVLLILAVMLYASETSAIQNEDEGAITISLSDYNPQNHSSLVYDSMNDIGPGQTIIINVNNVPYKDIEFFVIQVHSQNHSTVLSNDKNFILGSYVNGTNIGLVQLMNPTTNYQFYLKNDDTESNNTIYVAVLPYKQAPVPGGCNLEFMTEIAPYQRLKYTDAVITVDAQTASFRGHKCESQIVKHEIYQMYFSYPLDFSTTDYFDGIKNMLTVDNIYKYGTQVSRPRIGFLRELFNAYLGTGSIYVIVASVNDSKSAYVPIATYACDTNNPYTSCESLTTPMSKILVGLLVFLGFFTCFYGHRFFKTEMFLTGTLVGAYITFAVLTVLADLNERDMILSSIAVGIVFGLIWLGLWWYCGIPILSTMLPLLIFGFLVASIAFYAGLNDLTVVNNDITYWGFFTSIILLCMTVFTGCIAEANILVCGIVGSYALIISQDHYFGGHLKYFFINVYRRITVNNYGGVVINAPFNLLDVFLTLGWLFLAWLGLLTQMRQQRGRPPFPPTSARLRRQPRQASERTPLLMPTSSVRPSDRIILIHSAPSDA